MATMAKWGPKEWAVSSKKVVALQNLSFSFSQVADENTSTEEKKTTNERGTELFPLTFTTTLHSGAGVDVRSEIESWEAQVTKVNYFYLNGKKLGPKLQLRKVNVSDVKLDDLGRMRLATLSFEFKEYDADTTSVKAPRSGLYSAVTDGYEAVLTPESILSLTPASYANIASDGSASGAGKLIYGDTWYFVSCLAEEDAARLKEGHTFTLRFAKGLAEDTPVTVERISGAENGEVVVVFSCEKFLSNITLLRLQTAEIILDSFSGIRIPKTALRVGENGETGIYCRSGLFARYKPVEVVYTGTDYCLVRGGDPEASALATLREGDEVIVTAADLYDGKVVG